MSFSRYSSLALSVATLCGALVVTPALVAQAATKNPTATSILSAAKAALAKETGVHIVVKTVNDKVKSSVVADIGSVSGTETYASGSETFTITVTPKDAYLSGSKKGLTTLMGLTAAEQAKVGSESIIMAKGSTPYTTFKSNLTSGAFAQLLPAAKGTSLLAKRDASTRGYQLKWTTAKTTSSPKEVSTLVISSGAKALPLKEAVVTTKGTSHTSFTKWDEAVRVRIPSKTIAYAKVFPSS
jgi:hypothetical protein